MLREEVGEVCARRRPVADGIYIHDRQVHLQKSRVAIKYLRLFEEIAVDFAGDDKGRAGGKIISTFHRCKVGHIGSGC